MYNFIEFFKSDKGKTVISIIAAVIMYFTPDPVDEIITILLTTYGLKVFVLDSKV